MDSNTRPPIRFHDLVRERIRLRHLSYTTEKSYLGWIRRFILFHGKKHPREMGEEHIVAFLSDLAVQLLDEGDDAHLRFALTSLISYTTAATSEIDGSGVYDWCGHAEHFSTMPHICLPGVKTTALVTAGA